MPNLFSGLFQRLFDSSGTSEEQAAQLEPEPPSLECLQSQLQTLVGRAWSEVQAAQLPGAAESKRHHDEEGLLREKREQARVRMLDSILVCHQKLGTGWGRPHLEYLRKTLKVHAPQLPSQASLEQTLEFHILEYFYARCGPPAWKNLRESSAKAQLEWPVPPELVARHTPQEVDVVMVQYERQSEATFLAKPAQVAADLIMGEVAVWSHCYPEEGGWLWQETVLAAIGAAMRAHWFEQTLTLWLRRPPALEQELGRLLAPLLEKSRPVATGGSFDLKTATTLMEEVHRVYRDIIPRIVWEYASAKCNWASGPVNDLLLKSFAAWDPVCGMGLESDQLRRAWCWREEDYYFCSASCLERFKSSPESFFPETSPMGSI